jgi:hypothetical protein
MEDAPETSVVGPMALVDVELFVSSGAPRSAFTVRPTEPGSSPSFDLDVAVLQRHGWTIEASGPQPPEGSGGYLEPPSDPYVLGPKWTGTNCWRANLGDEMTGIVDHNWCEQEHERVDDGPPLASGSPWRWAFITRRLSVTGRAESPLHAAAAVEALALDHGSAPFESSPDPEGIRAPCS